MSSTSAPPSHVTESIADRKKSRELAEARQAGQVAPAIDVKTGAMINPHNPEFITKRPWYLGGTGTADGTDAYTSNSTSTAAAATAGGPSLDHQADPTRDQIQLSLQSADALVKQERIKQKQQVQSGQFKVGMWVEAMRHGKGPYRICQIIKISKKGKEYDLKYEDGTLEQKVKFHPSKMKNNNIKLFSSSKQQQQHPPPRIRMTKTGARVLNVDVKKHGRETYDSKRDKYHGYDPESHTQKVSQVFAQREELRKKLRKQQQQQQDDDDEDDEEGGTESKKETSSSSNSKKKKKKMMMNDNNSDSDSDLDSDVGSDSDDEFVQRDEDERVITTRLARQGGVGGAQMKVTARNLRIREDTAKYLRNLDANSAFYDPKSRSMRDNPNPEIPLEESQFAGDNFARISGDAVQLAETQLFAWDATEKSATTEMHPQANPSQVELLKKKFQDRSAEIQLQQKRKVLDKYGGQEYLDGSGGLANALETSAIKQRDAESIAKERKIRFGVSTMAEVYSKDGRALKGPAAQKQQQQRFQARVPQKSKYEEDVFINGHTTVWGSYFHIGAFQWGYADDHSLMRSSYCTGEAGRRANDEAHEMRYGTGVAGSAALAQARGMLKALPKGNGQSGTGDKRSFEAPTSRSRLYGEADPTIQVDQEKVKRTLERIDQEAAKQPTDDRKRKYNSMNAEVDVTEEDMEAYRLRKERGDDPMAKIGNDELLDYK